MQDKKHGVTPVLEGLTGFSVNPFILRYEKTGSDSEHSVNADQESGGGKECWNGNRDEEESSVSNVTPAFELFETAFMMKYSFIHEHQNRLGQAQAG